MCYAPSDVEIEELVWTRGTVAKLARKHSLVRREVEEALFLGEFPVHVRRSGDLYHAFGRTRAGRYVFVVFTLFGARRARIVTARDMTPRERGLYRKASGGG